MHSPRNRPQDGRGLRVAVTAAVAVAVVGFFTGIQSPSEWEKPSKAVAAAPAERRAPSYSELRRNGPGNDPALYTASMEALRAALPRATDPVVQTPLDRGAALAARAQRRAFDGAPPVIPHAVDQRALPNCLVCHERGVRLGNQVAPAMSHRRLDSCLQCHAPQVPPLPAAGGEGRDEGMGTTFVGLSADRTGERAYPGAPPQIPHSTLMRQNCSACHGVTGALGMRSTHPQRQSCTQCHAESAALDQRTFGRL